MYFYIHYTIAQLNEIDPKFESLQIAALTSIEGQKSVQIQRSMSRSPMTGHCQNDSVMASRIQDRHSQCIFRSDRWIVDCLTGISIKLGFSILYIWD